jgi:hypothetical protein
VIASIDNKESTLSYKVNPDLYCSDKGCTRPKETGRQYCTPSIKLAKAVGRYLDDDPAEPMSAVDKLQGRYRWHLTAGQ